MNCKGDVERVDVSVCCIRYGMPVFIDMIHCLCVKNWYVLQSYIHHSINFLYYGIYVGHLCRIAVVKHIIWTARNFLLITQKTDLTGKYLPVFKIFFCFSLWFIY
jgi:hypothetical protein